MSKTRRKVAEDEVTQTTPEPQAAEPQDGPEEIAPEPEEIATESESQDEPEETTPEPELQDEDQQALEAALLDAAPRISLDTYNASYRGGRMTAFQCAALGNAAGTHDRTAQEWEKARAAILGG